MANVSITPEDITYNWVIVQLDCKPSVDGLQDYVVLCHYRYNGVYQDIFKEVYGTCTFEIDPDQPNFIPYAELTEAIVIGWLETELNVDSMQASICNQINDTLNPPLIVLPLPWLNTEA